MLSFFTSLYFPRKIAENVSGFIPILLHMAYNLSGMALSVIPEDASVVVILLFVISIAVVGLMYRQILKVTADIPKMEESTLLDVENKFVSESTEAAE